MTPNMEAPITLKTYLICAFAAFGGILFGYDSGYINGILAICQFKKAFGHTGWPASNEEVCDGYLYDSWQKSLATSILSAGTFVGALVAGYSADWVGRKTTIILGCLIYLVGVVLQVAASGIDLLTGGRAVAGVGVGFVSASVIMYVSEVTPKAIRGRVIGGYQWAITLGILLAAGVSMATKDRTDSGAYRIPIGLQFAWALILGIGLMFFPESPRWYVMKGRDQDARKALAHLRSEKVDSDFVVNEEKELKESFQAEIDAGAGSGGWLQCFSGGFKRGSNLHRTLIGTSIQMFQQLTGVNFIFYFGTTFFTGIGIGDPFLISVITATVNVAATPIAFFTIDRFGRRPLLIFGAIGMCVCEFIVAAVGTAYPGSHVAEIVLIVLVCIYIAFFASTWGPTAWAVSGEIFPLTVRSKGIALSTASNWLWNFIISFCTPYIVGKDKGNLGSKVFFIWGSTCAACVIYSYFFVYETKGRGLEEVNRMLGETTARKSSKWSPTAGEQEVKQVDTESGAVSGDEKKRRERLERSPLGQDSGY